MNVISIKGTNLELTEAIKNYLDKKLASLEKLVQDFEPVAEVMVEVGKSTKHHNKGPYMRCEYTMHVPGEVLRAEEQREDLYEAIDVASTELKRQLKNYKDRLQERRKGPRPGKE